MKNTDETQKFNIQLGLKIKQRRESLKLSQEQVANEANLTAVFISRVERGITGLNVYNLVAISNALKVSPSYFLSRELESENAELNQRFIELSKKSIEKQTAVIKIIDIFLNEIENLS